MASMIGGLNPAATELRSLRARISQLENKLKPKPRLTLIQGASPRNLGHLIYDVWFQGEIGKLGRDSMGAWYIIVPGGSGPDLLPGRYATPAQASKAFATWATSA